MKKAPKKQSRVIDEIDSLLFAYSKCEFPSCDVCSARAGPLYGLRRLRRIVQNEARKRK